MNTQQIARLYDKIYSTPSNSPERDRLLQRINGSDWDDFFRYTMDVRKGLVKHDTAQCGGDEVEDGATMSYAQYKAKMDAPDGMRYLREISAFSMEYPQAYGRYREKYQAELDERRRRHNQGISYGKAGEMF